MGRTSVMLPTISRLGDLVSWRAKLKAFAQIAMHGMNNIGAASARDRKSRQVDGETLAPMPGTSLRR
jgi:hypothetical protein